MERTLKRMKPGLWLAIGAMMAAGMAVVVTRALNFDVDFDLDWDNLPA